jgi:NAD+ synthase|tara:strand:- start:2 stop:757 length:756 start_codon:yes stop_codon:yes gene_type:complete
MTNLEKANHIRLWISHYINNMPKPANCLVIGVSGGVDSSLTSTLCAMTNIKTLLVKLPINSKPTSIDEHIFWLKDKHKNVFEVEVDLNDVYNTFHHSLKLKKFISEIGFANSKARLRMTALYQIAASCNGIVVGTGNKVEDFGVGFHTKYGDGGVDISPIADLTKSDVRDIARELGVSERIVNAAPTDGLWDDGRSDEDQLGMTYEQVEDAMFNSESRYWLKYEEIRRHNLHKMKPVPVCKIDGKIPLETD